MDLSIVIPTCNRPDYLSACCNAIYKQIKNDISLQVIIVDDGSNSENELQNRETCQKYGFTYLFESNRGPAVARNTGIKAGHGEWIIFLDDDVLIGNQWYFSICKLLSSLPKSVIGIEGMVEASGDGIWDREVQNLNGGAYLTCHLAVRRSILDSIDGFDETFETLGPYGEDHELAARLLTIGEVIFDSSIKVTHLPRKVNLLNYIINAPERFRCSMRTEEFFYLKHPEHYCKFRYSKTFWGTYRSILFKNIYKTIKRRSLKQLFRNPLQFLALSAGAFTEQICAIVMIFLFVREYNQLKIKLLQKGKGSIT